MRLNKNVIFDLTKLLKAVKSTHSKSAAYKVYFGNKPTINRRNWLMAKIAEHNIDVSHWINGDKGYRKTKRRLRDNEEIFCKDSKVSPSTLRRRITQDSLLEEICALCGLHPFWNGKYLTLHLDHVDGVKTNNCLENLRFLCPNCHQQTETWGITGQKNKLLDDKELVELSKTMSYKAIGRLKGCHGSTISKRVKEYKLKNINSM